MSQSKKNLPNYASSDHKARKRFGQNFLHDPHIIDSIIRAIDAKADDQVIEIGPGQGALTSQLLDSVDRLQVIELDRDLIPLLKINFATQLNKLDILQTDALTVDFSQFCPSDQRRLRIVGNLPYNISTPLIFHLLDHHPQIIDMHFMLQKEVVERLAATSGSKAYGRLSIMTQYFCQISHLFDVPPGAFNPPPKVTSAIVRLRPHQQLPYHAEDFDLFDTLVREAFSKRRKTLRNTVKNFVPNKEQLEQLDVDLSLRPEQISLAQFVDLANQLHAL